MNRIVCTIAFVICLLFIGCRKEPERIAVESVTLNPSSIALPEGESTPISVTILPSNATNKKVSWATSNPSVVSISNGLVKALSSGKATISATSDDGGIKGICDVTVEAVKVSNVFLAEKTLELSAGCVETLYVTFDPRNATNKKLAWSSSEPAIAYVNTEGLVSAISPGQAIITVKTLDGGYTDSCRVTVREMEAIDLGSAGLWASCNLGANAPWEYGGYYQWAGLSDVTDTSINVCWENCPYHTGSNPYMGWSKYIPSGRPSYWSGPGNPDNKVSLDPSDDIASVILGNQWHTPSDFQFYKLFNACKKEWTTLNGVRGMKFTKWKDGQTEEDRWIFLPATGYRNNTYLYDAGFVGYYWVTSIDGIVLSVDPCTASCYVIAQEAVSYPSYSFIAPRYIGLSIRPVKYREK